MNWSEEEYQRHLERQKNKPAVGTTKKPSDGVKRWQALGRLPKGEMNKTEQAYAPRLEMMKQNGEIIDWKFHPMNMRLAKATFYEVDFLVLHKDMTIAIHETKGEYTSEKGQMKIKLAAETVPWFKFYKCIKLSERNGGGWKIEDFSY